MQLRTVLLNNGLALKRSLNRFAFKPNFTRAYSQPVFSSPIYTPERLEKNDLTVKERYELHCEWADWLHFRTPYKPQIEELVDELTARQKACLSIFQYSDISFPAIGEVPHSMSAYVANVMGCMLVNEKTSAGLKTNPNFWGPKFRPGEGGVLDIRWGIPVEVDGTVFQLATDLFAPYSIQWASARFGIDNVSIAHAGEIVDKYIQYAKWDWGGFSPAESNDAFVAHIRGGTPGIPYPSPALQVTKKSIENLKQEVVDAHRSQPKLQGYITKLGSCPGVGQIYYGSIEAGTVASIITGMGAGTGSAGRNERDDQGTSTFYGVCEARQAAIYNGVENDAYIIADGGIRSGLHAALMVAAGAKAVALGTTKMMSQRCNNQRACHVKVGDDACGVFLARGDPLSNFYHFKGNPLEEAHFFTFMARSLAKVGLRAIATRNDI